MMERVHVLILHFNLNNHDEIFLSRPLFNAFYVVRN